MVNFCQAEPTDFGGWIVGGGPGNDVPGDGVIRKLEFYYSGAKRSYD